MRSSNLSDPSQFGFAEGMRIYSLDPETRKAIIEANQRIKGPQGFQRFWKQVLTPDERIVLGGDPDYCYQENPFAVNHLVKLRGWSPEHSIIEIAYRLKFLLPQEHEDLLEEIGVSNSTPSTATIESKPSWDRKTGRLEMDGRELRTIKNIAVATKVVPVYDEFEEKGWPRCIANPFHHVDPQNIHWVVQGLNAGLKKINGTIPIKFYVGPKKKICWKLSDNAISS